MLDQLSDNSEPIITDASLSQAAVDHPTILRKIIPVIAPKRTTPKKPRIKPRKSTSPRQTVQTLLNSASGQSPPCTYLIPLNELAESEPKISTSSIIELNQIVPISITPATTSGLPSISAITLPMLSPKGINSLPGSESCLEDYVTNIVGQSLGHLGPNITSVDLVDKVTQVLKALGGTKDAQKVGGLADHVETTQNGQVESAMEFFNSQEAVNRFEQDPQWNLQTAGDSQILDAFDAADSAKTFGENELLGVGDGDSLKTNGVFDALKTHGQDTGKVVNSVTAADMLDMIMDSVSLPTTKPSDSLDQVAQAELIQLAPNSFGETNNKEFYCVDCDTKYAPSPCDVHNVPYIQVDDTPIQSVARISVPKLLQIRKSHVASGEEGIYVREKIVQKTKFGPLIGERRALNPGEEADGQYVWLNSLKTGVICSLDENKSNWMRFIQLARNRTEQNLVAFMENDQIHMVTCRDVEPNTELKFWYSAEYAAHIGITPIACPTLKCELCNRRLTSKSQLNQHRNYCHPDHVKHRCAYCPSEFISAQALHKHCRRHLESGADRAIRTKCGYCAKTFNNPGNLKVHMRIHTGEKRYSCDMCQRTFTQLAHLHSHLLIHSKVKNYQCSFCNKSFARTCDLKIHERTHTRENIMKCTECGKEFFKLDNYKCHMKIHLNQKDFTCLGCSKSFSKKYHLVRHMKTCKDFSKLEA